MNPIFFQCRVDTLLRILDVFAYSDTINSDLSFTKACCLTIACDMIEKAKAVGAREITEDRMQLQPRSNQIGISFSLIFKDNDSIKKFTENFF